MLPRRQARRCSSSKTFLISGIPEAERETLGKTIQKLGATYLKSDIFTNNATHVICRKLTRSEKFLGALTLGRWVIKPEYIQDSYLAKKWLDEQCYEWQGYDTEPSSELAAAARKARLRAEASSEKIFAGWQVAVILDDQKRQSVYKRLLAYGGAKIFNLKLPTRTPEADSEKLTYLFADTSKAQLVLDLQRCGVMCLNVNFVSDFLILDPPPDPLDYVLQTSPESLLPEVADRRASDLSGSGSDRSVCEKSVGLLQNQEEISSVFVSPCKMSVRASRCEKSAGQSDPAPRRRRPPHLAQCMVVLNNIGIPTAGSLAGKTERCVWKGCAQISHCVLARKLASVQESRFLKSEVSQRSIRDWFKPQDKENGVALEDGQKAKVSSKGPALKIKLEASHEGLEKTTVSSPTVTAGAEKCARRKRSLAQADNTLKPQGGFKKCVLSHSDTAGTECGLRKWVSFYSGDSAKTECRLKKQVLSHSDHTARSHCGHRKRALSHDDDAVRTECGLKKQMLSCSDTAKTLYGVRKRVLTSRMVNYMQSLHEKTTSKKVAKEEKRPYTDLSDEVASVPGSKSREALRARTLRCLNQNLGFPVDETDSVNVSSVTGLQGKSHRTCSFTHCDKNLQLKENILGRKVGDKKEFLLHHTCCTNISDHSDKSLYFESSDAARQLRSRPADLNSSDEHDKKSSNDHVNIYEGQSDLESSKNCLEKSKMHANHKSSDAHVEVSAGGGGVELKTSTSVATSSSRSVEGFLLQAVADSQTASHPPLVECQSDEENGCRIESSMVVCSCVPSSAAICCKRWPCWSEDSRAYTKPRWYLSHSPLGGVVMMKDRAKWLLKDSDITPQMTPVSLNLLLTNSFEEGCYSTTVSAASLLTSECPTEDMVQCMVNVLKEAKEEWTVNAAHCVLMTWLKQHPPVYSNIRSVYEKGLKLWDWECVQLTIDLAINAASRDTDQMQTSRLGARLHLKFLLAVLECDFLHFLHKVSKQGACNCLVVRCLWAPSYQIYCNTRTRQLLTFLERAVKACNTDQACWEEILGLIAMAAQCCLLADNEWQWDELCSMGDSARSFVQELATSVAACDRQSLGLVLSRTRVPWLEGQLAAALLSNYNDYLVPTGMTFNDWSLTKVVSQFFYLLPKLSHTSESQFTNEKEVGHKAFDDAASTEMVLESQKLTADKIKKRNPKGETMLHRAAMKNDVVLLREALSVTGIDVNVQDNAGWTPLHEACHHGNVECVRALLKFVPSKTIDTFTPGTRKLQRVNICAAGMDNITPLHDAVLKNHVHVVKLLLKYGGPSMLQARTVLGYTPLDLAQTQEMQQALTSASLEISLSQDSSSQDAASRAAVPSSFLYGEVLGDKVTLTASQDDCLQFLDLLIVILRSHLRMLCLQPSGGKSLQSQHEPAGHHQQRCGSPAQDMAKARGMARFHRKCLQRHLQKITTADVFQSLQFQLLLLEELLKKCFESQEIQG